MRIRKFNEDIDNNLDPYNEEDWNNDDLTDDEDFQ